MILRATLLMLCALSVFAHVGSPNVFFDGEAGPYPIRVMIRPPRVVPGLADIAVRVNTNGTHKVSVLPARWDTGRKGAPPPDVAEPIKGETNYFSSQLWLMDPGAYSVFVNVDGPAGAGTAIVPINSLATSRLEMPRWMSGIFIAFGSVLFVTLAALIGSAIREGSLGPGEPLTSNRRLRGQIATTVTVVIAGALLLLGKKWWDKVDKDFQNHRLYKPLDMVASVRDSELTLEIKTRVWSPYDQTELVPDHGKLMHLFLIEEKTGRGFAHLHPVRSGPHVFHVTLPKLPASQYHVYADITHESGFTQTLVTSLNIPEISSSARLDADDAFAIVATAPQKKIKLPNNNIISWQNDSPLKTEQETTLRFSVHRPDGSLATLEPYLGMYAHGVIWKEDGKVFTHLHPLGTISMTSQLLFARRERGEHLANQPLDIVCGAPPREISFPYAFPEPGKYRLWVQIRLDGKIHTATFDTEVL